MSENSGPAAGSRRTSTSTIIYSQEPFITYAPKAIKLLEQLFPNGTNHSHNGNSDGDGDGEKIMVERLSGGGYNRIVGATLTSSGKKLILRIPRFDTIHPEIADQAAVLRYLESLHTLPVPHVLHFDCTDQNPLSSSYMVQARVEGQTVHGWLEVGDKLTQEKRLEITKEVAKVVVQMCSTSFEYVGTLCAPSTSTEDSQPAVGVGFAKLKYSSKTPQSSPFSNTLDFLLDSFHHHILDVQSRDPKGTYLPSYLSKLKEVARAFDAKRPLTNKFCLLHNDFMARNILVKETEDVDGDGDGQLRITAILDWDSASSAPIEAAYVLPHWLWTWTPEEEDGIAEMANEPPITAELRAVKELFEREVERLVPGYLEMWREGFIARELFYFAINGFSYNEDFDRADRLFGMVETFVR